MRFLLAIVAPLLMLGSLAWAGTQDEARLALHYTSTCDKCIPDFCGVYSPNNRGTPCSQYTTEWFAPGAQGGVAYLVLAKADSAAGVGSVQFGIAYDPLFPSNWWTTCGDQEFPHDSKRGEAWLSSGSGNRIVWDSGTNCQQTTLNDEGVHAVVGVFALYAYASGEYYFSITGDSTLTEPDIVVEDCVGGESRLLGPGGKIGSESPGFNPCIQSVSTLSTTWGRIKATYQAKPN